MWQVLCFQDHNGCIKDSKLHCGGSRGDLAADNISLEVLQKAVLLKQDTVKAGKHWEKDTQLEKPEYLLIREVRVVQIQLEEW